MALYYIYGDESGKLQSSDYVTFCGYVGHAREWERVSVEWDSVRFSWGVPPLHMRCVTSPERPRCDEWAAIKSKWGTAWESNRDEMLRQFAAVILQSNVAAVGAVVDSAHFRVMPPSRFKDGYDNPMRLGFHMLLMDSLDKVDTINSSLTVSIVLDDDPEYAMQCYGMLNTLKNSFPRVKDRVTAMTFGDDKQYPGLQMADFLAYEARLLMMARLQDAACPIPTRLAAITRKGIHVPRLLTSTELDKLAKGINEKTKP